MACYWNLIDTSQTSLAGVPRTTLQQWLLTAQTALMQFATGSKVVQAQYQQGDGNRTITYTKPDMAALREFILELQVQLGIKPYGRRPLRPVF
jgi:hypothetical protein